MAYEQKDNSGTMFVNDKKEKDNHPDRKGSAVIDGTEYWVSGWLKTSKDGKPYLSLAFKPKDEAAKPAAQDDGLGDDPPAKSAPKKPAPIDDDIPF